MPIDAHISDISKYAEQFSQLRKLRAGDAKGNRTPEAKLAAEQKLAELIQTRQKLTQLQERGIEIQTEIRELLFEDPQAFLDRLPDFTEKLALNSDELKIIKSVAQESLRKHKTIEGVTARFIRSARRKLGREVDDQVIDETLQTEVGRQMFKAKTLREPAGKVKWLESPLAITISVTDENDVRRLNPRMPGGNFDPTALMLVGTFRIINVPFIFIRNEEKSFKVHEEGHAKNEILETGLKKINRKLRNQLYGYLLPNFEIGKMVNMGQQGRASAKIDGIVARTRRNKQTKLGAAEIVKTLKPDVWSDSLTKVKDEVIADFEADDHFGHLDNLLKHPLLKHENQPSIDKIAPNNQYSYQYLNQAGLWPQNFGDQPELHDQVAAHYNQELRHNVDYINQLWQTFQDQPDSSTWKAKLIAFMRQTPLSEWRTQARDVFAPTYQKLKAEKEKDKQAQEREDAIRRRHQELLKLEKSLSDHPAIVILAKHSGDMTQFTQFQNDIFTQADHALAYMRPEREQEDVTSFLVDIDQAVIEFTKRKQQVIDNARQQLNELAQNHPLEACHREVNRLFTALDNSELYSEARKIQHQLTVAAESNLGIKLSRQQVDDISTILSRLCFSGQNVNFTELDPDTLQSIQNIHKLSVEEKQKLTNFLQTHLHIIAKVRTVTRESSNRYYQSDEYMVLSSQIGKLIDKASKESTSSYRLSALELANEQLTETEQRLLASLPNKIDEAITRQASDLTVLRRLRVSLTSAITDAT